MGVMIMKTKKAIAALLALTMLAGLISGCSRTTKISTDRFVKACERLKLEEFEFDDDAPEADDIEDGVYVVYDEDYIEDNTDSIERFFREFSFDDVVDPEDVKSMAFAVKIKGADDFHELGDIEDLADAKLDGAVAIVMELDGNYSEDVMEYIEDWLDVADISTKDLTNKEYYSSKDEGYFRFHINLEKLLKLMADNDDLMDAANASLNDDFDELIEDLSGDIAVSVEINGSGIFILAGGSLNTKATVINDFVKGFGVSSDPMKIPMNEGVAKDLIDYVADLFEDDPIGPDINPDFPDGDFPADDFGNQVGISLPTKDLMRWNSDGERMRSELESDGYKVDLQYATNDINTQKVQIQSMIDSGCKVLIIAAIDSISLKEELAMAKESGITVIAYDRPLMESTDVDYYVSFDNFLVGVLQAEYIVNIYGIDNTKTTYNMEITAGDPSDQNAKMFYDGAYSVLQPYIDSGRIIIVSGQTDFIDVATPSWSTDRARGRAENIIGTYYPMGSIIDAWLCSNDSTALGVAEALAAVYRGPYPVVTGQDCDISNVKNIINGKQAMSVFKDTRTLASQAVKMAEQILEGQNVDVNDTSTYDNGAKIVPAYLCDPIFVDANNYRDVLIDSGYYTEDMLI